MPSELKSRWPEIEAQVRAGIEKGALRSGGEMKFRIIGSLHSPKSGRFYQRGSRLHQASAPGEPLATDYGTLEKSIRVESEWQGRSEIKVSVSSDVEHALNEFGYRNVAPRPTWTPIAEEMRPEVPETMATEIRNTVR
jgi:hypothetical protein